MFVGYDSDVIVAISTPSAQAVVAATKEIPAVYSAVTDRVAAQLVPNMEASETHVTAVTDPLALEIQIELIQSPVPEPNKTGMEYNPSEAESVAAVDALRQPISGRE